MQIIMEEPMGAKWEVNGWISNSHLKGAEGEDLYMWELLYMGNSFFQVLGAYFKNKKKYGCIKIERRDI